MILISTITPTDPASSTQLKLSIVITCIIRVFILLISALNIFSITPPELFPLAKSTLWSDNTRNETKDRSHFASVAQQQSELKPLAHDRIGVIKATGE